MDILFRKTIEQCRQLGARGGRAHAHNLRLRQSQAPVLPVAEIPGPPSETAHEASLRLDAQFPWLAAAFAPRPTSPLLTIYLGSQNGPERGRRVLRIFSAC